MRLDSQTVWLFANSMATCLASGLPPTKSLEVSARSTRTETLRKIAAMAQNGISQGLTISESLEPNRKYFPHYVIPVIQAGETGGRLVEAFQLLSDHSHRLAPTLTLVRNTWLYPLVCIVFGWIIRTGIYLYFGKSAAAWHFILNSFGFSLVMLCLGLILFQIPEVKRFIDRILLQLPIIRETEIHLATVLFFGAFRLVYQSGGINVITMFDLACKTVRNSAIRRDFIHARTVFEQGGSFEDAFGAVDILENRFKGILSSGAASGSLDKSLAIVLEAASQQLEFTLKTFNSFFQRVVSFCVAMSIVETIFICVM